jgi:hypothetical protein
VGSSPEMTPQPSAGTDGGGVAVPHDLRVAAVFAADLAAVVVFVLLGRSWHGEDETLTGILITLWPFLSGMLVGWLVLLLSGSRHVGYPAGAVLVVSTVAVGMVLRNRVSHGGTPVSFVIAASTFLTILHVGWRAVAHLVRRRSDSHQEPAGQEQPPPEPESLPADPRTPAARRPDGA